MNSWLLTLSGKKSWFSAEFRTSDTTTATYYGETLYYFSVPSPSFCRRKFAYVQFYQLATRTLYAGYHLVDTEKLYQTDRIIEINQILHCVMAVNLNVYRKLEGIDEYEDRTKYIMIAHDDGIY
jgi:hypothetical protein